MYHSPQIKQKIKKIPNLSYSSLLHSQSLSPKKIMALSKVCKYFLSLYPNHLITPFYPGIVTVILFLILSLNRFSIYITFNSNQNPKELKIKRWPCLLTGKQQPLLFREGVAEMAPMAVGALVAD